MGPDYSDPAFYMYPLQPSCAPTLVRTKWLLTQTAPDMKRTLPLILLFAVATATIGMTVSPGEVARQEQNAERISCPHGGMLSPKITESGMNPANSGRDCLGTSVDIVGISRNYEPVVSISRDIVSGSITVVGAGFESNSNIDVEMSVHMNGVLGEPFSVRLISDRAGGFSSDPIDIGCTSADSMLLVVATDETGNADAVQMDASLFACN